MDETLKFLGGSLSSSLGSQATGTDRLWMRILALTTYMGKHTVRMRTHTLIKVIADSTPVKIGNRTPLTISARPYGVRMLDSNRKWWSVEGRLRTQNRRVGVGATNVAAERSLATEMPNQKFGVDDGPVQAKIVQRNVRSGLRGKCIMVLIEKCASVTEVEIGHDGKVCVQFYPAIRVHAADDISIQTKGNHKIAKRQVFQKSRIRIF